MSEHETQRPPAKGRRFLRPVVALFFLGLIGSWYALYQWPLVTDSEAAEAATTLEEWRAETRHHPRRPVGGPALSPEDLAQVHQRMALPNDLQRCEVPLIREHLECQAYARDTLLSARSDGLTHSDLPNINTSSFFLDPPADWFEGPDQHIDWLLAFIALWTDGLRRSPTFVVDDRLPSILTVLWEHVARRDAADPKLAEIERTLQQLEEDTPGFETADLVFHSGVYMSPTEGAYFDHRVILRLQEWCPVGTGAMACLDAIPTTRTPSSIDNPWHRRIRALFGQRILRDPLFEEILSRSREDLRERIASRFRVPVGLRLLRIATAWKRAGLPLQPPPTETLLEALNTPSPSDHTLSFPAPLRPLLQLDGANRPIEVSVERGRLWLREPSGIPSGNTMALMLGEVAQGTSFDGP